MARRCFDVYYGRYNHLSGDEWNMQSAFRSTMRSVVKLAIVCGKAHNEQRMYQLVGKFWGAEWMYDAFNGHDGDESAYEFADFLWRIYYKYAGCDVWKTTLRNKQMWSGMRLGK